MRETLRIRITNREKQLLLKVFGLPPVVREQLSNRRRLTVDVTVAEINNAIGGLSMAHNHSRSSQQAGELNDLCERLECELLDRGLVCF